MSHLQLTIEATVVVTIGLLVVLFFVWVAVSLSREFRLRGKRITHEELTRERVTVLIPLSLRDLK